jgi:hypothetical protein
MNISKNMEIIFVAAAILATATSFATAASVPAAPAQKAFVAASADVNMPVVTVSAKRLTAAEKAALI